MTVLKAILFPFRMQLNSLHHFHIASLHEKTKQRVIGKMADTVGNGEFMCSEKHCNVHRHATENNKWIYVVRFCKNLKHTECANMRKRS